MAHRHELSEAEWARIAPLLPPQRTRGAYYRDHRTVLSGVLYRHATGCQWRDLPERSGPWSPVHSRFRRWTREGRWDRILAALRRELDAAAPSLCAPRALLAELPHLTPPRAAGARAPRAPRARPR